MTATTDLTFGDLKAQYDDDLETLREAYEDVTEHGRAEYGDREEWPDEVRGRAEALNESAKQIQNRQHAVETLAADYGDGPFRVKVLSGAELMDVELDLRAEAQSRDVDAEAIQGYRKRLLVDAATVGAPEGVPRADSEAGGTVDGDPAPSKCENPITLALYDCVERLNNTGATDFRAPGFESPGDSDPDATSATPSVSETVSGTGPPTGETDPTSGEN